MNLYNLKAWSLTEAEHELLKAIFRERQALKKVINSRDKRPVGRNKFAEYLNVSEKTLNYRIAEGLMKKPFKEGQK